MPLKQFANKTSDEELVNLVRSQDQELYVELVKRYQNKLLRYATHLIRDENKADDIVQESFIKAFINLHSFDTKKKFSSWIYRIVHNEAISLIRKYKDKISIEENNWVKIFLVSAENIEENFNKGEIKKIVTRCLFLLPVKYRSPLALFYIEEKSYSEISDILRLPVNTIGTRISRAKKLMATVCKKEGGEVYV